MSFTLASTQVLHAKQHIENTHLDEGAFSHLTWPSHASKVSPCSPNILHPARKVAQNTRKMGVTLASTKRQGIWHGIKNSQLQIEHFRIILGTAYLQESLNMPKQTPNKPPRNTKQTLNKPWPTPNHIPTKTYTNPQHPWANPKQNLKIPKTYPQRTTRIHWQTLNIPYTKFSDTQLTPKANPKHTLTIPQSDYKSLPESNPTHTTTTP